MRMVCLTLATLLSLFAPASAPADERVPESAPHQAAPGPRRAPPNGGWRAVRRDRLATIHDDAGDRDRGVRVSAQSPDEPRSSAWRYSSARSGSVSVPDYRMAAGSRVERSADSPPRLPRRSLAATRQDYDSEPAGAMPHDEPAEPFYSSPFDSPRTEPAGSAPASCRSSPFEDACAGLGDSNYSWDNLYFFAIGEAFRFADQGTRGAARFGLNWGLPLFDDDSGLGMQFGGAVSAAEERPQHFATVGAFYRGDMQQDWAWNVGAVFDWMNDHEFDAEVGQFRAKTSITLDRKNEIGVWGSVSVIDDKKDDDTVEPVDQINLFYRYLFEIDWDVTGWAGWRRDPDSFALGIATYVPINNYWAGIFGAYYAFEGDTWNVYSGLVRHWCDRARQDYLGQDRHQPYLPVADTTSMTLSVGQ